MKRRWWVAGIGLVMIGGAAAGWNVWKEESAPAAAAAVTTVVRKGELTASVSGTGGIEPLDRETLVSPAAGTVETVRFRDGDAVKKGDVLLTFEQEDAAEQLETKRVELERQRLELEQLQLQYKEAAEGGETAQQSIAISIKKQELTIRSLENEIASLQQSDAVDPITAPIDGKLSGFDVEPGDALRDDAELGEIVNFAGMKMIVGVDELDIADVAVGQEATVRVDALPDRTFAGKVADIAEEGTANNGVAAFDVTVVLTDIEGLKAGMSAEASIVTAKKEETLVLPIDAVQSFRDQYFVLVPTPDSEAAAGAQAEGAAAAPTIDGARPGRGAAGGTAGGAAGGTPSRAAGGTAGGGGVGQTRVVVEVGIHNEDSIEILSGLSEGDEVILPTPTAAAATEAGAARAGFGIGGFGGGAVPGGFGGGAFPAGGGGFGGGGRN